MSLKAVMLFRWERIFAQKCIYTNTHSTLDFHFYNTFYLRQFFCKHPHSCHLFSKEVTKIAAASSSSSPLYILALQRGHLPTCKLSDACAHQLRLIFWLCNMTFYIVTLKTCFMRLYFKNLTSNYVFNAITLII